MPGFKTSAGSPASEKPRPASGRANKEGHALVLAQGGVCIHECFDESEHERVTQTIQVKLAHQARAAEVLEHSCEPRLNLCGLNPLAGHLSIWRHRHSVATCRG